MFLRKLTVIVLPLLLLLALIFLLPYVDRLNLGLFAGVIVYQYLETQGTRVDVLHILATKDSSVIFLESLFMGYMGVTCLRTHK